MDNDTTHRDAGLHDPVSREALQPIVTYVQAQSRGLTPSLGIVCGSGLGNLADLLIKARGTVLIDYRDIPGFPVSTAPGHKGRLVIGNLNGITVILMQGRMHVYEGHPLWRVTLPIRVMKMLGVRTLLVTNAVGSINPSYQVGDIMMVKDHINMFGFGGQSPLRGPNDESFGPRFFAVNDMYHPGLRGLLKEAAKEVGMKDNIHEGVLTLTGGPNFESPAELRMFSLVGVDCVGMSSIPESLVAHHCGIKVLAMSLITNKCLLDSEGEAPNHAEVLDVARGKEEDLKKLITKFVEKLQSWEQCQNGT